MATMKDSTKWNKLCQQFMAITNANSEIAGNMLEATGGNLQQAINLHMENSFNEPNTSHYNSSGIGDASAPMDQNKEEVRDPIPQRREVLVQGSNFIQRTYRKRKLSKTSAFDSFRDYREEAQMGDLGETSSYSSKKRTLNDLFRPPIDLIHRGDFESARQRCQIEQKWLLVNVQDMKEFSCQVLNRDVWSQKIVRDIIKEHFIFWQVYCDSDEGYRYTQLYSVSSYPHIAIIDPRSGGKLLSLSKTDVSNFCETVTQFLSENLMIQSPSKDKSKSKQNILDRSEESQLEAAIAASIKESSVNHNARCTNDGTVILDSDSDVIFSKSDDGDNESDSYEEDICVEDATIRNSSTKNEKYNPEAMATSPALRECNKIDLTTDDRIDEASTTTDSIKFLLRFPNGDRRYTSFPANATIKDLLKFVSDEGYDMHDYELITAFPRRNISGFPLNSSLINNGLQGNDTIFVQMK